MKRNKYFPRIFDQNGKLRIVYGFKKEKKTSDRNSNWLSKNVNYSKSTIPVLNLIEEMSFIGSVLVKVELVVFDKSAEQFINFKDNAR